MTILSPVAQQVFRELKAANRVLLRAMAHEKIARARHASAASALAAATRNVKLLLDTVQPELPASGPALPGEIPPFATTRNPYEAVPDGRARAGDV
jgi:hypothetical protein